MFIGCSTPALKISYSMKQYDFLKGVEKAILRMVFLKTKT